MLKKGLCHEKIVPEELLFYGMQRDFERGLASSQDLMEISNIKIILVLVLVGQ